jgi:CBS domain-containing protein
MKVREVMMKSLAFCSSRTNLAEATEMMWVHNCGILPVVDEHQKPIGVITDRDICIALGTRNRPASEITVGEVTNGRLFYCAAEDDLHSALEIMHRKRVRRLPVVGKDGLLDGILSMDDVVLHAEKGAGGKDPELTFEEVVETYKGIAGHPLPQTLREKVQTTKVWR